MKALETEYNGIKFRSRLEARWALLFDTLGVEYIYEPECFVLKNDLKYTPDFYLPKWDLYVEIKPDFKWIRDKYHYDRYKMFSKKLLVLSGSFPNFKSNCLINGFIDGDAEVVFVPNSKYEPFFYTGSELGGEESLFEGDYEYELEQVKRHRFWN